MKHCTAFLVAGLFATGMLASSHAASAQQTAPAAAEKTAPAATTTTEKPKAKEARAQCREDAKTKGLKGAARQKAVEDCFIKARPDLAAAEKCRLDPKLQALDKDVRKAAIKECLKKR